MSDFSGLGIGLSGLQAHRRALDVAGHNLANVNTAGYTRQRVNLSAIDGSSSSRMYATWPGGGQGVRASGIERLNDRFLDTRSMQEHGAQAGLARSQSALSRIELSFDEPSDNGISKQIGDFLAAWDDLANHPEDRAARVAVVNSGKAVAAGIRVADASLRSLRASHVSEVGAVVNDVNQIATQIATLNGQIQTAKATGDDASDLADHRDLLLHTLAEKLGATATSNADGITDVFVGSVPLVQGTNAQRLAVDVGSPPEQTVSVRWPDLGIAATPGGDLGAIAKVANEIIPRYRTQLADVANKLQTEVNNAHQSGFDLRGNAGTAFFVTGPDGIDVASTLSTDPSLLAAANSSTTPRDGSIAAKIAGLTSGQSTYRDFVVGLGSEVGLANRQLDTQSAITDQVDKARNAASGVNIDEEMTNMVAIQHAYAAAARFLTAVDQSLDTLINGTGRVGR